MKFLKCPKWAKIILFLVISLIPAQGEAFEVTEGIRFGAFSIHPSVLTSIRYVDNIYFLPNDYQPENRFSVPQQIESDFIINVQPAVLFDVTIPTFTTQVGYRFYNDHYLEYDDPGLNHNKLNASNHTFSGLLDYRAPFGLILRAQDAYTNQQVYEDSADFVDFVQGEQVHNDARGTVGYAYGPEDALYMAYTYINIIDEYERYNEFDKMTQMHNGEMRFKFFPRTAAVLRGGYNITDYERIQAFDSVAYWGMAGVKGQFTRNLILTVMGGYTVYDYQENADGQGLLGDVVCTFVWPSDTKLSVGYRRRFKDAVDTNYYTSDEAYLMFNRLWGSRVNTSLFGSYQYNDFSDPLERQEDYIQAKLDITLRLIFWLYTGAGYNLDHKIAEDGSIREVTTRNMVLIKLIAQF